MVEKVWSHCKGHCHEYAIKKTPKRQRVDIKIDELDTNKDYAQKVNNFK